MTLKATQRTLTIFCLLGCSILFAQAQNPAAPSTSSQAQLSRPEAQPQTQKEGDEEEKQMEREEQSHRLLGVIPNFGTTRQDAPPLTPSGKFRLFERSAFDPAQFVLIGLQAGLSQAEDEFPEYGQGAAGYGKRYGAAFADQASAGFFSNFFYPVLLKQDPRYFRLGKGSIKRRFGYALLQEVDCHTDRGTRNFAWANVLGAFSAGGLSNAYYPRAERGFGLTMSRSAISIGYGSLGGLVDEFYPDIMQRLRHRKGRSPQ